MSLQYFQQAWRIRGSNMPSRVYRYTEQEFIEQFFETGKLKLSSFNSNRIIEDHIRNDKNEGYHSYRIISRDRSKRCELKVEDRDTRKLFCCSTKLDLKVLTSYFNVNGCFEITNSLGFGYEVSKVLNSFHLGQEGFVNYTDDDFTYFLLEQHLNLPDLTEDQNIYDMIPYIDFIGQRDLGMFFHKIKKYAPEHEYRFVWKCQPHHDLFINCPGAIKFCKKIT